MNQYKNNSRHPILIQKGGKNTTVMPGQVCDLEQHEARKLGAYLTEVNVSAPQMLTEAPMPLTEVEPTPEVVPEPEVVTEPEVAPEEEKPKKKKRVAKKK